MMPAASNNKIEPKPSMEAGEPSKVFMTILDKKVRNIEKRKSRLDTIKSKAEAGGTLEREQQETLKHYNDVVACLEFARDMQKTFGATVADLEKQEKKRLKKEKAERTAGELKRTADILQVQTTLDALGNDSVREHFKTGKHGAVVLTDDNLNSLDELYKLISPPAAGEEKFAEKLSSASEHVTSLVEAKDRPVLEAATYKELWDLMQLITNCGYFERAREAEEAEESTAEEAAEETEEAAEEVEEVPTEAPPATETFNEQQQQQQPPSQSDVPAPSTAPVPTPTPEIEEPSLQHSQVLQSAAVTHDPPAPSSTFAPSLPPLSSSTTPSSSSLFPPASLDSPAAPQQPPVVRQSRPLAEIVSQVEGTFSFLQESEIDLDSPHAIDPAVVVAQPMMRAPQPQGPPQPSAPSSQQPPQAAMLPGGFPTPSPQPVVDGEVSADPLSLSQQSLGQASSLDYSGASQSFGQSGPGSLSHSQSLSSGVVADAMFQPQPPTVEDPPAQQQPPQPPQQQQQQPPQQQPPQQPPHHQPPQQPTNQQAPPPHGMMGQGMGPGSASAGGESVPQFDIPPSIPLPPSQQQQDAAAAAANQLAGSQEKKFQLNASATEFQSRSMYSQMPLIPPHQPPHQNIGGPPGGPHPPPPHPHQPPHPAESRPLPPPPQQGNVSTDFSSAPNFAQAAGDFSQGGANFQGAAFQRGGRGGGSPGFRGGPRGGGNRGGNAGGGNNLQNGFNNRPQNGNPRPTGRGGAAFQGFPPRNDYRPDGFQGYNSNGFGGGAPYQKRGGQGGPTYPRGGNNRGAGGMRGGGGLPRGGGPPRGASHNRGGMGGRPGNQ